MSWKRSAFVALIVLATTPAWAQQRVPYTEGFEAASAGGWTRTGLWAVDGTPSAAPGGAVSAGAKSLNFNNGRDFAGTQRGSAVSPAIVGNPPQDHFLRFRCNYQTETTGTRFDKRHVIVRSNGAEVANVQLAGTATSASGGRCGVMGAWHNHELRIPGSNQSRTQVFQIELKFDSVDGLNNGGAGWFVDDLFFSAASVPAAQVFTSVVRTTNDFRQYNATIEVRADRSVEIRQSSPTARYALVTGRATDAEWQALEQSIANGRISTIAAVIPDPNTYIVQPTGFVLEITSANPLNANRISGTAGLHGQWAAQLDPVIAALDGIQRRLLGTGGGSPTVGDDHSDTMQNSTVLSLDPSQPATAGAIDPKGDVDFFQFAEIVPLMALNPPPQSTYTVEATVVGNMDTVVDLVGPDGKTVLATNDDFQALGLGSRIEYTAARGTLFFVKVRHYSAEGTGSYSVRVTSKPVGGSGAPTDDHANSAQGATVITVGDPATAGAIEVAGDQDWFQSQGFVIMIFPPPVYTYVFETSVSNGTDTVLELYDLAGNKIAENDDAPGLGLGSRITRTAPAAGYHVKVRHYSAGGTGPYTVRVTQVQNP